MAKKDCLIMETRIPNLLVTYNYFSIAYSPKKYSVRDRNPPNMKREIEQQTVSRFHRGLCENSCRRNTASWTVSALSVDKDRYRISIRSIKTRDEPLRVKENAVTHMS